MEDILLYWFPLYRHLNNKFFLQKKKTLLKHVKIMKSTVLEKAESVALLK